MSLKRSGINSLAYCGVEATQPPQFEMHGRAPTANDYISFNVGTIWLDISGLSDSPKVLPTNEQIYMLVSKNNRTATWVNMGGGDMETLTGDAGGVISPDASDNINITTGLATLNSGSTVYFKGDSGTNTIQLNVTDANSNTNLGRDSGKLGIAGANNTSLGFASSNSLTTSANNSSLGSNSLQLLESGGNNLAAGQGAGPAILTGSNNIFLGQAAGTGYTTSESGNIVIGNSTCLVGETGVIRITHANASNTDNIFIGHNSGNSAYTLATAISNVAVGGGTFTSLTTGNGNSAGGNNSGTALQNGINNALYGAQSGDTLTSGSQNTMIGYLAGSGCTIGDNNVYLGQSAGATVGTTGSNNIMIHDPGVAGDNFTMRVGLGLQPLQKSFIGGISGVTTTVADAVPVLISNSTHQLGVTSSSRRYKQNIEDMGDDSSIIMELRPVTFNFKKHPDVPAWGLIAEEVAEVFPQLAVYNKDGSVETVKYHEIAVLLLNELQKMSKRLAVLEKKLKG